ncbi:hypothetical protein GF413_06545, partial [Candidatus Micrarchaeota archaeon]|nr:hypothetical protein [Candidatus Micrarchaeota archaeon]
MEVTDEQAWAPQKGYFGAFDVNKFYKYVPPDGSGGGAYFIETDGDMDGDGVPEPECTLPSPPQINITHVYTRADTPNSVFFAVSSDPATDFIQFEKVKIEGLTGDLDYFTDSLFKINWLGEPTEKDYLDENGNPVTVSYAIRVDASPKEYTDVGAKDICHTASGLISRVVRGAKGYHGPNGGLNLNCLTGHLLNYMTTTRIGASRIALVGGKGDFVDHDGDGTDDMYERRLEGIRAYAWDDNGSFNSDNLAAFYHRRAGEYKSGQHYPDDYDNNDDYHSKDIYLTIANYARGFIRHQNYSDSTEDLKLTECGSCSFGRYTDLWTFTIASNKEVRLDMVLTEMYEGHGNDYDPKLALYRVPDSYVSSPTCTSTDPEGKATCVLNWLRSKGIIEKDDGTDYRFRSDDGNLTPYDVATNNNKNNETDDASIWTEKSSDFESGYLVTEGGKQKLIPGTYLVLATTQSDINDGSDYLPYILATNDDIQLFEVPHDRWSQVTEEDDNYCSHAPAWYLNHWDDRNQPYANKSVMSNVGTLFDARVRVRLPMEAGKGFIQEGAPFVRYGWMIYSSGPVGDLEAPCKPRDGSELADFVQIIKGKTDDKKPGGGTLTGYALGEAYDYYARQNYHSDSGTDNSHKWSEEDYGDPYRDPIVGSGGNVTYEDVPCRKSITVLISDGFWKQCNDPIENAWELNTGNSSHNCSGISCTNDIRSDIDGKQTSPVYSIFSFNARDLGGMRALQSVAAFGSFADAPDSACNERYPYPFTKIPSDWDDTSLPDSYDEQPGSREIIWPLEQSTWADKCNPLTSYDEICCREWDEDEDYKDENGNVIKGIPDNFFQADDAEQLRIAMRKILADLLQGTSAAGAVATVSQEVYGGDLIIRAAFEAVDEDNPTHYAWYGHLEGYWPYLKDGKWTTEYMQYPGELCHEIEPHVIGVADDGTDILGVHCWDSAEVMRAYLDSNSINSRTIYARKHVLNASDEAEEEPDPDANGTLMQLPTYDQYKDGALDAEFNRKVWKSLLGVDFVNESDPGDLGGLTNWLRGAKDDNIDTTKWRKRSDWIYGDIVYSTPVVGGIPPVAAVSNKDEDEYPDGASDTASDGRDGYQRYRNRILSTMAPSQKPATIDINNIIKRVVFVGANDGMVHAVVAAVWNWDTQKWVTQRRKTSHGSYVEGDYSKFIGRELWAFVPTFVLPDLKDLADKDYAKKTEGCPVEDPGVNKGKHRDMVDLSEQVWQVFIRPPGDCPNYDGTSPERCWRSVLIGGQRGGGDTYFALDVTDVDNPILLWEYSVIKDLVKLTGSTSSGFEVQKPMDMINNYDTLRSLPMSWTEPFVGRIKIPGTDTGNIPFHTGEAPETAEPVATTITSSTEFEPFHHSITSQYAPHKRHVAFIGARFQIYDEELNANPVSITDTHTNKLLKQPTMLALDVETGENLFKYIWPFVYGGLDSTPFDPAVRNGFIPPCAFADPSAVDVWNTESGSEGDDGYVDHIFAGDMCGNLWGIKLFGFEKMPTGDTGLSIEMWPTRIVDESNTSFKWSNYRTEMQPITFQPAMSITPKGLGSDQKLRVIVGTGKYDNTIPADYSDKSDPAIMSLYNLEYPINMNIPSAPSDYYTNLYTIDGDMGEFHLYLTYNGIDYGNMFDSTAREEAFTYDSVGSLYMPNCRWVQEDDSLTLETSGSADPDCCRRNPANSSDPTDRDCSPDPVKDWWRCVYDFTLPNRLPWGFINTDADGDGSYEQTAWSWFGGAPDTV